MNKNELTNSENILNPKSWVTNYADGLYNYAMGKTSNSELSEDLVQETFLAGLKSLKNFKGLCSEKTWLFSILKFKIADHYRKASTKREISLRENEDSSYLNNYFNEDGAWKESARPASWAVDYSRAIENKELAAVLEECLDKLPFNQKQVVLLKLVEEDETENVCKELNITATNYWVLFHRAKILLRACIEKNWIKS